MTSTDHKHSLQGKLAIVTGASRGIGAAIAVGLASKGACVVVNYAQSKDEAEEVVKMCKKMGGNAVAVQADVGDVKQCKKLIDKCLNLCGEGHQHIHILINNAGIAAYQPVSEGDEATLDKVFATEVKGPFFLAKYAMQHMPEGGRIINISSVQGTEANPQKATYAMAKAALNQLTKALAVELGAKGITVNTVSPGAVESKLYAIDHDEEKAKKSASASPMGRIGQPEDISDVVVWMCTKKAKWVTGQNFHVDGGALMV